MHWLLLFPLISLSEGSILGAILGLGCGKGKSDKDPEVCAIFCGDDVPKKCKESKYRSYDGSCNNLKHSWWSTPYTAYERLLPNTYSDGTYAFRRSKSKKDLPNPRTCSLRLFADLPKPDLVWNVAFMQYGQLIAHDMAHLVGIAQKKKGTIKCCSQGKPTSEASTDPRCANIVIPKDDPYNGPQGITCMHFYRSESTKDRKCTNATKVASPLTSVTPILDMSFLYGSDKDSAMNLRECKGGRLKSVKRNNIELLTQVPDPFATCNVKSSTETCYLAGDSRVNQNPQLSIFHNLHLVQHNSIVEALAKMNPHWDDEKLFQEGRRIMIAMYQHIIYKEFLPPLLGLDNLIKNKVVYVNTKGYIKDYDPDVCAAVSVEFASAAYRLYHSEIVGSIHSYDESRNIISTVQLSDWMDRPSICETGNNFLGMIIGLANQPQSAVDQCLTTEVLNLLSKYLVDGVVGQDVKAFDIKRERDHGCATYYDVLKNFKFSDPKSFDDFTFIDEKYVKILKDVYDSYMDVDLGVGISLEKTLPRTLCGPVGQKIMTDQFLRARIGDRFFYENDNGIHSFTLEQLEEIRKASMASYFCHNSGIEQIQSQAFILVSPLNPLIKCSDIPKFDPTPWKEDCKTSD